MLRLNYKLSIAKIGAIPLCSRAEAHRRRPDAHGIVVGRGWIGGRLGLYGSALQSSGPVSSVLATSQTACCANGRNVEEKGNFAR